MSWIDIFEFIKPYLSLAFLGMLAAAVQTFVSEKKSSFKHYLMAALVAMFAGYLAEAFCNWLNLDTDLTTGIIGLSAYSAPHIFDLINKILDMLVADPKGCLKKLFSLSIKTK
jgi:hypothetical protein